MAGSATARRGTRSRGTHGQGSQSRDRTGSRGQGRRSAFHCRESYVLETRQVDQEQGIIYDVKILGYDSENDRRYKPEAIDHAIRLYEGIFVNVDHPDRPTQSRSSTDRTAWLEKVHHVKGDGLRGNLRFLLPLDEFQKKVLWAAQNKPDAWGLSHNADGQGQMVEGIFVVEEITEVRSVDLVPDPATNHGLFESKAMKPKRIKVKAFIEANKADLKKKQRALFRKLLEWGDDDEMEMDAPPDDSDAGGDWKDALSQAIATLVAADDPEAHDKARKILNMLKPASAEEEDDSDDEDAVSEDDDSDDDAPVEEDDDSDDDDATESKREVKRLRAEQDIRDLLEDAGLKFTTMEARKTFIKSLVPLQPKERKALIEERRPPKGSGARSHGQGTFQESRNQAAPKDAKEFATTLLR